jgi:hypothetical protein
MKLEGETDVGGLVLVVVSVFERGNVAVVGAFREGSGGFHLVEIDGEEVFEVNSHLELPFE